MRHVRVALQLGMLVAAALALRGLGVAQVFPGDGLVDLEIGDSAYHARRALFSFVNFPSILLFDSYIAYPTGAAVPMPPLYDWALAAVARGLGEDVAVFERVAAWFAPVLAALTVLPVYAVGRALGGHGLGLGSAALFVLLPASARMSSVGDVDHHAAVALLGAALLAGSLASLRSDVQRAALWRLCVGMALLRCALLLTWSGSLLLVAIGEGTLLLVGLLEGRRASLLVQAASCALAALLVAPWLASLSGPVAPGLSATQLSWLHVVVLSGVAAVAGGVAALSDGRSGAGARLLLAVGLGIAVFALALLALPGLREELEVALRFLAKDDSWGHRSLEQQPLSFAFSPGALPGARDFYGLFGYAIPLAFVAVLARLRQPRWRTSAAVVACWMAALGALALSQARFASDFAPVAAVGFALLLAALRAGLARTLPGRLATAAVVVVAVSLLWPGLVSSYGPKLRRLGPWLERDGTLPPGRLASGPSMARFARRVGEVTPETSGYLDARVRPEYAVLTSPSHGHTFHYMARRATPANGFGPYLDADSYIAAELFYLVPTEGKALALTERTGSRYVVTFARERPRADRFADRLHHWDGGGPGGAESARRFRLVAEGPPGGTPRLTAFPSGRMPPGTIPYKLFEVVEGAVLEGFTQPGAELSAELWLETPLRRRFPFRSTARADASGRARLRVPYATERLAPVRAEAAYRVKLGDSEHRIRVSDAQVREGAVVPVP